MDTNNNDWLPAGYKVPKPASDFMKLEDGANKVRIMSAPTIGYEYWNKDGKPVRVRVLPESIPTDIRIDSKTGQAERIKHFWAFIVWNYGASRLQVLEVTQATVQSNIQDLVTNPDWGNPSAYDITIVRKGQKLETEYSVQPSPHKPVPQEAGAAMKATKIDLSKLFEGGDVVPHDAALDELDRLVDGSKQGETVIE